MALPERLRALIDQRHWSAAYLDRQARLSAGSTLRYLDGKEPSLGSLRALAEALEVPVAVLLGESAPPARDGAA
jgi:transcriptional regulator with XRE-family HTH domain